MTSDGRLTLWVNADCSYWCCCEYRLSVCGEVGSRGWCGVTATAVSLKVGLDSGSYICGVVWWCGVRGVVCGGV